MTYKSGIIVSLFSSLALVLGAAEPLVLENRQVRLGFEARSGAWMEFIDRHTGDNLIVGTTPTVAVVPTDRVTLDRDRVRRAIAEGQAQALEGEWLYTPAPPKESEATELLQGRFAGVKWAATPVPSRRGTGDDRLHNRAGSFWYRREFTVPREWPGGEAALVIGAVDDFDETWLNDTRIGGTDADTPHHWETARCYRFPEKLLNRSGINTLLIKVINAAFDGGIDGPVALGLASALHAAEGVATPLASHAFANENGGRALRMTARELPYEYRVDYALAEAAASFTRQITVRNVSEREQLYQTANYVAPPLAAGPDQAVVFPGSVPSGDQALASLPERESLRPRSEEPLAVLWSPVKQRGVGTWFHCEEEYSPVSVKRAGTGAVIRHTQRIVVRLKPGESVALGRQYFWLAHGNRDAALDGVQEVYRAIGLRAPANGLPGLRGMVMYCGHSGGTPELNFLRYGGFKALRAYVPVLRKLNMDLLWLLPTWEHGDGAKWNLYSPFDHYQVDHLMGTADDLKQLSHDCATNGIQLMFDLVPHGPPDFTPLAKAHPEWVARKPDGAFQTEWGQLAFDNHHPGWQDYMRRVAQWDVRELGAVGARVDCSAGGPLNWNREVTSRPSLSSLAAGLGISRAIREGFARARRGVVVLPEEYTGANLFHRVGDLTFDAQFYYLQGNLLARRAPPEEWARAFQQFLHDQQRTLPPGSLKMRWISNHDTVSWTFQKQRPVKAYGLERMRALLALCAFIEGVPMLYQSDKDPAVYGAPGESSVEFLARIYALRKQLPALREGAADYTARAEDGVFACLRSAAQQKALVLISFNPASVTSNVYLPPGLGGVWQDRLSGERIKPDQLLRVAMPPYQVRVLTAE